MPIIVDADPEQRSHDREDDAWVRVGSFASVDLAFEHGLVLLARGSGCRVQPASETLGGYALETPAASVDVARDELRAYERESLKSIEPVAVQQDHDLGAAFLLFWTILLLLSYRLQIILPQWQEFGVNSSQGLIENGQWWRPLTSLFLHADMGHLLSNVVTGALFAGALSRMWGAAKCWAAILFCGTVGNALNSLLQYPEAALSFGASTAVMATLGLLCAHGSLCALAERSNTRSFRQVIVPVAAGIALFGITGNSDDPDVNVLGHACGFVSGLIVGLPFAWRVIRLEATSKA